MVRPALGMAFRAGLVCALVARAPAHAGSSGVGEKAEVVAAPRTSAYSGPISAEPSDRAYARNIRESLAFRKNAHARDEALGAENARRPRARAQRVPVPYELDRRRAVEGIRVVERDWLKDVAGDPPEADPHAPRGVPQVDGRGPDGVSWA